MRLCIKKSDNRELGLLMIALRVSLHRRPMHTLFLDYFESRVNEISKLKKYVPTHWNISLCYQTKFGLVCCAMQRFS